MTDILSKPPEEDINYEEDDEETRDFYIYILSREHPTVLTPVANPYKRCDRIKEANAELQSGSPVPTSRIGAKIRFNDTPILHEYVKQEDLLFFINGDSTSQNNNNCSPIDQSNPTNVMKNEDISMQLIVDKIGWSNESEVKNKEHINGTLNKDNTKHIDNIDLKSSNENQIDLIKTDPELTKNKNYPVNLSTVNSKRNSQKKTPNRIPSKDESLDVSKMATEPLEQERLHGEKKAENKNGESYTQPPSLSNGDPIETTKSNKTYTLNETSIVITTEKAEEENPALPNDKDMKYARSDEGKVKETNLNVNDVEISPIINNTENKLNYRPSSNEKIESYRLVKLSTTQNGSKNKTGGGEKDENLKTDSDKVNKITKINGTNKKTLGRNKWFNKQEITSEITIKNTKPQVLKTNKPNGIKAQNKDNLKPQETDRKNSVKAKLSRRNSIELQEQDTSPETKTDNPREETPKEEVNVTNTPKHCRSNEVLLSTEEVKSKLEEIKERNRSKLVVLVPPFEQYKSYMNDNYSDSDDNESFDLEEFLRKEDKYDLTYLPDFELESDNELDKLCKGKANLSELGDLYPENVCRSQKTRIKFGASFRKKARDSSKRMTTSLEDNELRRHQSKMMDNIKSSSQYENSVRKFTQDSDGGERCKQKCSQRPATAPGGRKFGCDCKWPRVKLPEYNGLRSEYGLSAEQLNERKRQRQEITRRTRERRQRKVDEEERRKMENERMFHEWLLKKRQQAKEQWMKNQRLRAMRYNRQCITPNQTKTKLGPSKTNTPLAIRKKLHPGRNCFSLDEIINDVTENNDDNKTYKIYLGLSVE